MQFDVAVECTVRTLSTLYDVAGEKVNRTTEPHQKLLASIIIRAMRDYNSPKASLRQDARLYLHDDASASVEWSPRWILAQLGLPHETMTDIIHAANRMPRTLTW